MTDENNKKFGFDEIPAETFHLSKRGSVLPNVLAELNALVRQKVIEDYAIGGGYAVMYHGIPYSTFDLDILVVLGSEADFRNLYSHYRKKGNRIENVYIYIEDMPVQFLPNYISPLFNNAIKEAKKIKVSGVTSKVVKVEYLIALLLTAFRPKDKIHIMELSKNANINILNEILKRFDDGQNLLSKRLGEILGNS